MNNQGEIEPTDQLNVNQIIKEVFRAKLEELKGKINIGEAQAYYNEVKTKLALTREKSNEITCFNSFYEQLSDYQKVKVDLGQINKELYEWICNMFAGLGRKEFKYIDIQIERTLETQELLNQIVQKSSDQVQINPLEVFLDFHEVLQYASEEANE